MLSLRLPPVFNISRTFSLLSIQNQKITLDYSRFPKLDENDIEEMFISGHGPGGSKVNKSNNCCLLKHKPTERTKLFNKEVTLKQKILFTLMRPSVLIISRTFTMLSNHNQKIVLDYSRYPKLNENDIEEQFISGHGPGGQNVNKSANCCLLKHKPTGIVVKCHESRLLQDNQKIARKRLLQKLDDHLNGDMSISSQQKKIEKLEHAGKNKKRSKLREMKKQFKEENCSKEL